MIAAVTTVLDAAGVENAVWVGNSMGGWVAWRGAIDAPERVSGLVLIDAAGAQVEAEAQPYLGARLAQSPIGQAIVPYFMPRWIVKSSLQQNYAHPERLREAQIERYWELLRLPGNRRAVADRANADREAGRWNDVSAITAPTLILWGEADRVIPVAHAHAFAGAIANSSLLIYPDVGHLPMEENAERVSNDIATWLAEQVKEGAP
jgi:pimeloyl-ACP methyl ester carboxylesterase